MIEYIVDSYTKSLTLDADSENNEIIFVYSPISELTYTVRYVYEDKELRTEEYEAKAASFRIYPDEEIVEDLQKQGYEITNDFILAELVSDSTKNVFTFTLIPSEYDINYLGVEEAVWGDSNSTDNPNPTKYCFNEGDISIVNPKKNGYIFDGWSIDDKVKVEEGEHDPQNVVISSGSRGNLTLTANWKSIDLSPITGEYADAEDEGNNKTYYHQGEVYLNVYLDGELVQSKGSLKYGYEQYDCVDVKVTMHKDYVLNGVYAIQSDGLNGAQPISVDNNVIHVDNVADKTTVYIYLTSKYTVQYVLDPEDITQVPVDSTIYTKPSKGNYDQSYSRYEPDLSIYGNVLNIKEIPEVTGYNSIGWIAENSETISEGTPIRDFSTYSGEDNVMTFTANFTIRTDLKYEVHYFYDGVENKAQEDINEKATFGETIPYNATQTAEYNEQNYVLEDIEKTGDGTVTTDPDKNIVNIYYTLDVKSTDPENPDQPDGTPDKYQATVTYKAGENGKVKGTTSEVLTYKTFKKADDGTIYDVQDIDVHPAADVTAVANDGYAFVDWTSGENTYGNVDDIKKLSIKEDTTFTANFTIRTDLKYEVHYFYDGVENKAQEDINEKATFGETIPYNATQTAEYNEQNYVLEDIEKTGDGTVTTDPDKNIVNIYYTLDVKSTDPENPDQPDGTPDKYQARIDYTVTNGTFDFSYTYVTLFDEDGNWSETGKGTLDAIQIPTATANAGYDQSSFAWQGNTPVAGYEITGNTTFNALFNAIPVTPTPTPDGGGTTTPTTPTTPGARTTDDGTTTDEPEVEEVEDDETPLSDGEVEEVEDNATPKSNNSIWALINLIAAIVTVILGLFLLLSKRHRNDEDEDEDERQARMARGEEKEQEQKRGWICKVLGVIVAIVSVVFFILTEDMSLPMALTDKWTIWMIVIAIIELVLVLVGRRWKDVDDDEEQQA